VLNRKSFPAASLAKLRAPGPPAPAAVARGACSLSARRFPTSCAAAAFPLGAPLVPLPVLGLLAVFARERRQRLEGLVELSNAYRGTALVLGDMVEADDGYTGEHSRGVVRLSVDVGAELGLDARQLRNVEFAALLHDPRSGSGGALLGRRVPVRSTSRRCAALNSRDAATAVANDRPTRDRTSSVGGLMWAY
jgi:hypothetical protein